MVSGVSCDSPQQADLQQDGAVAAATTGMADRTAKEKAATKAMRNLLTRSMFVRGGLLSTPSGTCRLDTVPGFA